MGWRTPEVGDRIVILDGAGVPLCIIWSTAVETMPFDQVDDRFALLEGEGFRDRSDWRAAHWRYFSRRYQEIGREPTRDMPVVCHEFRVVHLVRTAGTRATPWDAGPR